MSVIIHVLFVFINQIGDLLINRFYYRINLLNLSSKKIIIFERSCVLQNFIVNRFGSGVMAFDYKKEYKEFYLPKREPHLIQVPSINYIAVKGCGDPNEENGEYKQSIELLYAIAFTIKMSYKGSYQIKGYFSYVVPPLEGLWWQEGNTLLDYSRKQDMKFISMIRLPDFVTKDDVQWAIEEACKKKKKDFSKVQFFTYEEDLCVQCMHIGSYDKEPDTILLMNEYMEREGYELDMNGRFHHEIYLSDPRRCDVNKLKTVIRHPIQLKKKNLLD